MLHRGLVVLIAGACLFGTGRAAEKRPADVPAIQIERVIDEQSLSRKGKGRKLLRWVTGRESRSAGVLSRPYGVAWAGNDLLVTDPGAARVLLIDLRNRVTTSQAGALVSPIGVAVCTGGVVVSDSRTGKVAVLDSRLRVREWIAEDLQRPTGVACDGARVFVLETGRHRVLVFGARSSSGDSVRPFARLAAWGRRGDRAAEFNFPTSIAFDGDSIWVGDTLNFRIQRLDAQLGTHVDEFGRLGDGYGEMPRIKGLTVDAGGNIWISDAYLDEIAIYDSSGVFLTHLGAGTTSTPALLSFPAGLAAHPDGRVAVVDSLNRRILVFRLTWSGASRGS